jgi:hypothetical protein
MRIEMFLFSLFCINCLASKLKSSDFSDYNDVFRIITGNLSKQDKHKLQKDKNKVIPINSYTPKKPKNYKKEV